MESATKSCGTEDDRRKRRVRIMLNTRSWRAAEDGKMQGDTEEQDQLIHSPGDNPDHHVVVELGDVAAKPAESISQSRIKIIYF